jgi:putative membrane protein
MQEPRFRFFGFEWVGNGKPIVLEKEKLIRLVGRWLLLAFSVGMASTIVGGIHLHGLITALTVAAILGLLNLFLWPFLFAVAALPLVLVMIFGSDDRHLPIVVDVLGMVVLGLSILVTNAALLGLTSWIADRLDLRFEVTGVEAALLGAIVISFEKLVISLQFRSEPISF